MSEVVVRVSAISILSRALSAISFQRPLFVPDKRTCQSRRCCGQIELVSFVFIHFPDFRYEPRSNPDSLKIRQYNKPVNPFPTFTHRELNNSRMCNELPVHDSNILRTCSVYICVQIVILPKYVPNFSFISCVNPV